MAYRMCKALLAPILRIVFRLRVEGVEHVPASGPVILAANHRSFIDSVFIPFAVPRRVTFVAKAEYFESWKTKWFFSLMGQIPIKRGGGSDAQGALDAAAVVLGDGGVFGIYPEGTRSPDGRLYKGRTGVARLALKTGAPVVPVGLIGTAEAQPIGKRVPKFFKPITIRFGSPLTFDSHAGLETGGEVVVETGGEAEVVGHASNSDRADLLSQKLALRQVTDELMFEIRELCEQPYVNEYAPKKKGDTEVLDDRAPVLVRSASFALADR